MNGSGKSSLLRIMAGEDKEFEGEAVPMPNMRIGFLPQEPQLDAGKTVRETVEEGLGDILEAKKRLEEIYAAYAEPDADFDTALRRTGEIRGGDQRGGRGLRPADGDRRRRAAPAAVGREDRASVRRRKAPRRAVPPAAVEARHAAAGRADQPPRRRERRLARAVPAEISRDGDRRHPRPLLPRQRGRVDPRTRSRLRHSVEGQLQLVAGAEGSAPQDRGQAGGRADQGDADGTGMGALESEGAAGQEQGAHPALRGAVVARAPEAQRDAGDLHSRWRSAWATA